MRIALFLCLLLLPWQANAEDVSREYVEGRPRVVTAIGRMPLRAEPDLKSETVGQVQLMRYVWLLGETGPSVVVSGHEDRWVRVAASTCAIDACETYRAGWVLESFLGYDNRFETLDALEPTTVTGDDGRNLMAYGIRADGSFSRWSAFCIPGMCSLEVEPRPKCPEHESRRGVFCVITGMLYRYRNLVRGRDADGKWLPFGLRISSSGKPCPVGPDPGIDWDGGYSVVCSYSKVEPAAAVEGMMDEKRKRVALVAAEMAGLRDAPTADAEITGRLPMGTVVTVYGPAGSLATIDGWPGRWVRTWVTRCQRAVDGCVERASGWLIDGVLAFEDRLQPMQGWREGVIGGRHGNRTFRYETARDGTVRFSEACDDTAECSETVISGRLYRYENLVVAKFGSIGRVDTLYIDEDGALCLPEVTDGSISYEFRNGRPSRCDR